MATAPRPWRWKDLGGKPGVGVAERLVVGGATSLVFGLGFLIAFVLLGVKIQAPEGTDQRLIGAGFAAAFWVLGLLVIRAGVRAHRHGGGVLGPRNDAKTR
jgi:hypothetical protein